MSEVLDQRRHGFNSERGAGPAADKYAGPMMPETETKATRVGGVDNAEGLRRKRADLKDRYGCNESWVNLRGRSDTNTAIQ